MSKLRARFIAAAGIATMTVVVLATPASAHEARVIGGGAFHVEVGWAVEPTYTNVPNAVALFLHDADDQPIKDLGDTLQAQVGFGSQTSDPIKFEAAFGDDFGTPGEYHANVTPTRAGVYTFHITGTVRGKAIDEKFTSSDSTFDSPKDAKETEFPVKDPSNADLASKLDRTSTRLNAGNAAALKAAKKAKDDASRLAMIAIVVGGLGLVVGLTRGRRAK